MGDEQLFALRMHLARLVEHLLKLPFSARAEPRRPWPITVDHACDELEDRLTPILRKRVVAALPQLYARARRNAVLALEDHDEPEGAAASPPICPYTLDQLLDPDWLPPTS